MTQNSAGFLLRALLLVVSLIYIRTASAQNNSSSDFVITKRLLSVENGLASHEVFCGLQDAAGFIWLGTRNGLNRYDGKNCLLFSRQRNQLQDNKVVRLAKDDANHLFIQYGSKGFQLTTNGKVDVMDATTHEAKTLTNAFPKLPFREEDVYWIANDGTDEVSFLTAFPFRLWKYSSKKGFRLRYEMSEWNQVRTQTDYRTSGPLCSFINGKALLKLNNQEKQYLVTSDKVVGFRQHDVLRSLPVGFTDTNELLITYNKATSPDAFAIDAIGAKGILAPIPDPAKYKLNTVVGKYWYQVCVSTNDTASALYIATDALYLWNKKAFMKVIDKSELRGFENLFIYQLFPDTLGNLWLCTSLGVLQLTIRKNRFKPYFSTSQQTVQANSQARGIYADPTGKVAANIWTHSFLQQGYKTQAFAHEFINYALVKHQSALYTGSYSLSKYDDKTNRINTFQDGLGSEIWSLFSLNDSLLLLGRTNGFSVFNSNTEKFDSLSVETASVPEARFVYRFFRDKAGMVWAVAENGLYNLQPTIKSQTSSIDLSPPSKAHRRWSIAKIQSPFVNSLSLLDAHKDENGVFWLATNGEGLFRWDPKTNSIRQFNITSGFPSDVLYRIESDQFANLWISSDYGLVRFNRKNFLVNTYTTADGITHNEFNRTSSFRASDGTLFFGGLNGVNAFDPRDFKVDSSNLQIPLRIISFNQFVGSKNELVNKTNELLRTGQILLYPSDKFFTLDFQLLDFTKDEGHRYAYKIEGQDKNWNYINENSIRISGLPYGNFKVHVKAQNREGIWSRQELNIPLIVLKPVYLQWWFVALAVMFFFLSVYLLINFRLRQLARDKRKLEETVNERTTRLKAALSEQSTLLLEKDVLMKEIHHRVKNNLQVISGLFELQSKTLKDETAREALQEGRNRVRSIALIHQNLYQFENLSAVDLKKFVHDLSRQVQSIFQIQSQVTLNIQVPDLHLDIDSAVPLGLILNELLSNSFKYAFASAKMGEINLKILPVAAGKYQLQYSDNGPGLPADFPIAKSNTLGLQLIQDLSRQIGGKVQYSNDHGAVFTINFTNRDVRKNED